MSLLPADDISKSISFGRCGTINDNPFLSLYIVQPGNPDADGVHDGNS